MVYKALHNELPSYMSDMFQYVSNVHDINTRQKSNNNLYLPPRAKICAYRNSIRYAGANAWNCLPSDIREAPSSSALKKRYFNMYLN